MTLTDKQRRYVAARAQHMCERRLPDCTIVGDHIELALDEASLQALHRSLDNPDSWLCCCTNCTQTT